MIRKFGGSVACLMVLVLTLSAQQGPQRAKVKKVDADKKLLTLTVGGEDREFQFSDRTKVAGAPNKTVADLLADKSLKEGTPVMFLAAKKDGKAVLVGLKVGEFPQGQPPPFVKVDSSKLKPIPELGNEKYQGFEGGLYLGGKNERPAAHEAAGLALAKQVQPLDAAGKSSPNGKIVLLTVGMSNTSQVSGAFQQLANADQEKNPKVVIVNGAQGGQTAFRIKSLQSDSGQKYWAVVDQRLKEAGVSRAQVQAAWIKEADAGPRQGFPGYAKTLEEELEQIVQLMHSHFPNLKLVYLSGRTYGGYARTALNPEPYAYESGFSVRWLIEKQLKGEPALNYDPAKGEVRASWLSWGPYLWANGTRKNADGFSYEESDFGADGTHPSGAGQRKVGERLLQFFKSDTTTRPWFVRAR